MILAGIFVSVYHKGDLLPPAVPPVFWREKISLREVISHIIVILRATSVS